jgi:penicillin amidase
MITHEWSSGFRAQRIEDLILAAPRPITLESLQEIQGDNYDLLADELVPRILALDFREEDHRSAQSLLAAWDRQADLDSAPAALYMVFWQSLQDAVFADDLPEAYQVGVESRAKEVIRILLRDPDSTWWDDQTTPELETRDQILANTFRDAVRQLKRTQGKPEDWQWGSLHTITFQHQVMTNFPVLKKVFDRGPYAVSGGTTIINATGWDPEQPYEADSVPSMRMLIDFDELSRSLAIHTTGQSGHAYHKHYQDMAESWRLINYHPMLWDREMIIDQSEGCLTLKPSN